LKSSVLVTESTPFRVLLNVNCFPFFLFAQSYCEWNRSLPSTNTILISCHWV